MLGSVFAEWLAQTNDFLVNIMDVRLHFSDVDLDAKQVTRWIRALRQPRDVRHFELRTTFSGINEWCTHSL